MSLSLRDQLLQAGLVKKDQIQKANKQQRHQVKTGQKPASEQQSAARKAEAAKAARDQELNRQRQEKAERKARMAQIYQLIEQNRLPKVDSDDHYNFTDGSKIKRISVNADMRAQIMDGRLAIVRYRGYHEVVPEAIAARIRERDAASVIALDASPAAASSDENDPYKNFAVPDDLMW